MDMDSEEPIFPLWYGNPWDQLEEDEQVSASLLDQERSWLQQERDHLHQTSRLAGYNPCLHVANVSEGIQELTSFFSQFGSVHSINLHVFPGSERVDAYVSFFYTTSALKALKSQNHFTIKFESKQKVNYQALFVDQTASMRAPQPSPKSLPQPSVTYESNHQAMGSSTQWGSVDNNCQNHWETQKDEVWASPPPAKVSKSITTGPSPDFIQRPRHPTPVPCISTRFQSVLPPLDLSTNSDAATSGLTPLFIPPPPPPPALFIPPPPPPAHLIPSSFDDDHDDDNDDQDQDCISLQSPPPPVRFVGRGMKDHSQVACLSQTNLSRPLSASSLFDHSLDNHQPMEPSIVMGRVRVSRPPERHKPTPKRQWPQAKPRPPPPPHSDPHLASLSTSPSFNSWLDPRPFSPSSDQIDSGHFELSSPNVTTTTTRGPLTDSTPYPPHTKRGRKLEITTTSSLPSWPSSGHQTDFTSGPTPSKKTITPYSPPTRHQHLIGSGPLSSSPIDMITHSSNSNILCVNNLGRVTASQIRSIFSNFGRVDVTFKPMSRSAVVVFDQPMNASRAKLELQGDTSLSNNKKGIQISFKPIS